MARGSVAAGALPRPAGPSSMVGTGGARMLSPAPRRLCRGERRSDLSRRSVGRCIGRWRFARGHSQVQRPQNMTTRSGVWARTIPPPLAVR